MGKLGDAFAAFFAVLKGKPVQNIEQPLDTTSTIDTDKIKNDAVTQILSLLQREGRFIDFLKEDISNFTDEQVGHAVREIHKNCQKTLDNYLVISPIITDKNEGEQLTLSADDYDPKQIKLIGNVPESAPYTGRIQHKGWHITSFKLPQRQNIDNDSIIYQAECHID